ncbi:uncharacterized protein BCR38DRAFT_406478 [Pseudomassariella vexata]|uniref:SnoaL-like domain-containing protein n=1 Tax=Pseudomassariella vexata TaxID=1141098 RepID=A0A1Y2EAW6_9PEZI|nr:uncharacterized protein BCR38DRAFT_406478 [Pseudomassariella vexata]ORY68557.1 hypothetical protein BCR38DRAFT_406478 [Pseudomassariella vexata]
MDPTIHSRGIQTVNQLLDGYSSLSVETLLAPLSESFQHRVLPESLGMPARDKAAFTQHATGVFSIFENFQLIPKSICENMAANFVVVYAGMKGTLKAGKGEWRNECIMMIRLSTDGRKIVEVNEFVDSAKAMEMRQKHAPKGAFGGHQLAKRASFVLTRTTLPGMLKGMNHFVLHIAVVGTR